MNDNLQRLHRRSIRLKGYDYTQEGYYFVTVCTHNKKCIFGDISNQEMHPTEIGEIAKFEWLKTAQIRDNVRLDEFIIMPNHVHGIIQIICRGVSQYAPTKTDFRSPCKTIDSIMLKIHRIEDK